MRMRRIMTEGRAERMVFIYIPSSMLRGLSRYGGSNDLPDWIYGGMPARKGQERVLRVVEGVCRGRVDLITDYNGERSRQRCGRAPARARREYTFRVWPRNRLRPKISHVSAGPPARRAGQRGSVHLTPSGPRGWAGLSKGFEKLPCMKLLAYLTK